MQWAHHKVTAKIPSSRKRSLGTITTESAGGDASCDFARCRAPHTLSLSRSQNLCAYGLLLCAHTFVRVLCVRVSVCLYHFSPLPCVIVASYLALRFICAVICLRKRMLYCSIVVCVHVCVDCIDKFVCV